MDPIDRAILEFCQEEFRPLKPLHPVPSDLRKSSPRMYSSSSVGLAVESLSRLT